MRVAITGGTGTLGRALIGWLSSKAERIVSISRDEVKASEVRRVYGHVEQLRVFIGDVREERRLRHAFHGCDTVIHTAALKQVQTSVYSPLEMLRTNIDGTVNVIEAALASGVGKVMVVSSDKAVQPVNLYGVTKAAAEAYAVQSNAYTYPRGTRVSCIRYGNVMGSRGSVIEPWTRAIQERRALPVTDRRMTRFFLSVTDAVRAVLAGVQDMVGGEIYVPEVTSCRLVDLASAFAPNYPQVEVGMREGGEKLHELLITQEEQWRTKLHPLGGFVVTPAYRQWSSSPYEGIPMKPEWSSPYASDNPVRMVTDVEQIRSGLIQAGIPVWDVAESSHA